jgi:hypothetical protein
MTQTKHWFLVPSMHDPFYVCGGMQIFMHMHELVSKLRSAEIITYRHLEDGYRYLDDIPSDELGTGVLWVTWQSHIIELAKRLSAYSNVVLYAQAEDFGRDQGQVTPIQWPIVCLSRYIAADYSVRDPGRLVLYHGTAVNPGARNAGIDRDLDVLVHKRKSVPYLFHELVPALQEKMTVEIVDQFINQADYFSLLNRTKTYLYWFHKTNWGTYEGFGMQPLEAILCGSIPVSNFYGGLSDYLEAPFNCKKIGVHSLDYDVAQIQHAVSLHDGHNPDENRLRQFYGDEMFIKRFLKVEEELMFYFERYGNNPAGYFELNAPQAPFLRRPYIRLHRMFWRTYRRWKGITPH